MPPGKRWAKPIVVGDHVTLRPMTADDAAAVWEMVNDAEGNDLTATAETFTHEQIEDWCASRAFQDDRLDLAIVENSTGTFAGEVVFNDYDSLGYDNKGPTIGKETHLEPLPGLRGWCRFG